MPDLTTLQSRLEEAETAYHELALGNKMVEIRVNGRWLQKTPTDMPQLMGYIKDLKKQINRAKGGNRIGGPIELSS